MKDTEYLTLSAWIRTQENRLLTRERRDRMVECSDEEWIKLFTECGYPEPAELTIPAVNEALSKARAAAFEEIKKQSPQKEIVEVLQIKYDYHNAKAILKAASLGEDPRHLLAPGGRYPAETLPEDFGRGKSDLWSEAFTRAVAQARAALEETRDPQKCDLILDRACYAEMTAAAEKSDSSFLKGYVELSIDAVNLRSAVRCARMGLDGELLREALLPGGTVAPKDILKGEPLSRLFSRTALAAAAQLGEEKSAPGAGALSEFERACDNALNGYLASAKRIPFGEQPVVGYLCARESEATAIRTILSGRKAGLSPEAIRERLRESYV